MDEVIWVAGFVSIVQLVTGCFNARAARKAVTANANNDLLAEVTIGKGTVKFDKSDILAIAFSIFVFWGVKNAGLSAHDALVAFSVVLGGVGLKEVIQAWYPST